MNPITADHNLTDGRGMPYNLHPFNKTMANKMTAKKLMTAVCVAALCGGVWATDDA